MSDGKMGFLAAEVEEKPVISLPEFVQKSVDFLLQDLEDYREAVKTDPDSFIAPVCFASNSASSLSSCVQIAEIPPDLSPRDAIRMLCKKIGADHTIVIAEAQAITDKKLIQEMSDKVQRGEEIKDIRKLKGTHSVLFFVETFRKTYIGQATIVAGEKLRPFFRETDNAVFAQGLDLANLLDRSHLH